MLLLKYSLEPWKTKSLNTRIQFQKKVYIDKLDYMVNKYNNTYHSPIKMKPVDVKPNTYIDSYKETNKKNTKCKIGDNVRISNNKNSFAKGYTWNLSEEVFVSKNS